MGIALVLPLAWGAVALTAGPSDGTLVVASSSLSADPHWSDEDGVPVRAVYGDGALAGWFAEAEKAGIQPRVLGADGAPWGEDASAGTAGGTGRPTVGQQLAYLVAGADGTPVRLEVTLTHYPVWDALRANVGGLVLWLGLAAAGSFVFWRRSGDPAARALLSLAVVVPIGMTAFPLGLQVVDLAGGRGVWPYVVGEVANALAWGSMLFFACAFPEPMQSLRDRPWLRLVPFAVPFALYGAWLLLWGTTREAGLARTEALVLVSAPSALLVLPLIATLLVVRTRKTHHREHQLALRIVLGSVLLALLCFVLLGALADLLTGTPAVALHLQPLALAIPLAGIVTAILRYRLYEVDLIVRRSLLLVVAAIVVGGLFVATAAAVTAVLPDSALLHLVAGGVIAMLLLPLARLLSNRLSRLVLGPRDDPYRVVSELRDITSATHVEDTLSRVLDTLARSLRLSYAEIDVRPAEEGDPVRVSIGTEHRAPTVVDLRSGGRPWGRLTLGVARGREPFGPRDERLLDDVATQIGTLVESLILNQALQHSRELLVTAREEERKRLRMDLHDRLGPDLAMVSMHLDNARRLLADDPTRVDALLAQIAAETRSHITEVRRLVDDLRPQALDQLGLVTALRERASGWSTGDTTMRWTVDAADVEPLPAAVEVAAYRIVLEAVHNAAKHSRATTCRVALTLEHRGLHVAIADNGRGTTNPARPGGVGLTSMRQQAEELGGAFSVESTPGRGTTVTALLPFDRATL
ncbi:ATP-binding protein [Nocardioides sp. GCM10028917]|uniref:sensor histidine kinase n=1 Tax=Nocardioides sp. GCM10028917 TaxID=3273408 RepID=UPI003611E276